MCVCVCVCNFAHKYHRKNIYIITKLSYIIERASSSSLSRADFSLSIALSLSLSIYIYIYIYIYPYLPTPPLGQDMTQGQFLSGDYQV